MKSKILWALVGIYVAGAVVAYLTSRNLGKAASWPLSVLRRYGVFA